MNIHDLNSNGCCACGACINICTKKCIDFTQDEMGLKHISIDSKSCINCGLCITVCPLVKNESNRLDQSFFAIKRKNILLRTKSQSGGAFSVIAEYVISKKGVVYGVVTDKTNTPSYKRITRNYQVNKLRGSKYVNASTPKIMHQIENDLKNNKTVLLSGVPCQLAGIKNYLLYKKISIHNLIIVDMICHGLPKDTFFKQYLSLFKKEHGNYPINHINFRDKKRYGWSSNVMTIRQGLRVTNSTDYTKIFYSSYCLDECCFTCKYSNYNRIGDITIGDFWGVERVDKTFYDEYGVSLLICNTICGKELFDKIADRFIIIHAKKEETSQRNLLKPTEMPKNYHQFYIDYYKYGFEYVVFKYCGINPNKDSSYYIVFSRIKHILKRIFNKLHKFKKW